MMTPSVRTGSPTAVISICGPRKLAQGWLPPRQKRCSRTPSSDMSRRAWHESWRVCRSTGETTRRSHLCLHSRNAAGEAARGPVYTHTCERTSGCVRWCRSITALAFLTNLPRFHKLSVSTNRPAFEWAQGMACQNSCEKERRDVRWIQHVETGCYCRHTLGGLLDEAAAGFYALSHQFDYTTLKPCNKSSDEHRQVFIGPICDAKKPPLNPPVLPE